MLLLPMDLAAVKNIQTVLTQFQRHARSNRPLSIRLGRKRRGKGTETINNHLKAYENRCTFVK